MIKFFSFFILFIWFLFPCNSFALNLDEAADQVAEYFQKSAIKLPDKKSIYIQVLNQFSLKKDSSAKKIETEIYLAMQRRFTGYRLFLDSNQDAAAVMISGMYEPRGNAIHLTLKAFDRNNQNEILGQTEVDFIMDIKVSKKLVAVLDLEAKNLSETQIKAFSDVFRSALFRKKAFNLVASAEIDKFDPDEIQNKTGCTS
ncbi:MAG: hypothetical protein HOD92_21360, partial [Deltaproteobacteria bacterium]|nr:hypothetical protein [Deltaproteobacteria bacterium]